MSKSTDIELRDFNSLQVALDDLKTFPDDHLFPVTPGTKRPLLKTPDDDRAAHYLAVASNSPRQIKQWSKQYPGCWWGLAAKAAGYIIVDVDGRDDHPGPDDKQGRVSLAALAAEGLKLPRTRTQLSPSGGKHLILRGPHRFSASKVGLHIDTPNYVVLAGCGSYTRLKSINEIADAPQWLLDKIAPRANAAPRASNAEPISLDHFKRMLKATPYKGGPAGLDDRHSYEGWLNFMMICHEAACGDPAEYLWQFVQWSLADPNHDWKHDTSAELIEAKWCGLSDERPDALTRASWFELLKHLGRADFIADAQPDASDDFAGDNAPTVADLAHWKKQDEAFHKKALKADFESDQYSYKNFAAYMPDENAFIFVPRGADEMWPGKNVNTVCPWPKVIDPDKRGKSPDMCEMIDGTRDQFLRDKDGQIVCEMPTTLILRNPRQRVSGMTWWPGKGPVIFDKIVRSEGGVIPAKGVNTFNRYRKARLNIADAGPPTVWLEHVKLIYPDDWQHIVYCLASRVQHPEVKIMHALVLGGATRIGKDTILKPVTYAIGPWNFKSTNAQTVMDEPKYNGYLEAAICLINEAKDFGDQDRFGFYERTKPWLGGTASGVLMVADKYVRVHPVIDVVFIVITTNHKVRGLYLPEDDARHYVAWSNRTWEDWGYRDQATLDREYFGPLYDWYAHGGYEVGGAISDDLRFKEILANRPAAAHCRVARDRPRLRGPGQKSLDLDH